MYLVCKVRQFLLVIFFLSAAVVRTGNIPFRIVHSGLQSLLVGHRP